MVARTTSVQAESARWSFKIKNDQVVEFTGVFPKSAAAEAFATSRFLHRSNITHTGDAPRRPEEFSDAYKITLSQAQGDNLPKFQQWAIKHHLVPTLPDKLAEIERKQLAREYGGKERYSLAYAPAPQHFTEGLIKQLTWEQVDTGYPQRDHQNEALVMSTDNPQLAFQVGLYLKAKDYIDAQQFTYLNQEIRLQLREPEEGYMFRIAVPGSQLQRFEESFPDAGVPKRGPDAGWLAKLAEFSGAGQDTHNRA